ncbi:MAG: lysylphosphatidylglycerol synthase transmembrane domain-containing protein [Myxococcota bacterium]
MKRVLQGVIGVALSLGLLWLSFRGVDWEAAYATMARVPWWVYVAYVAQLYATYFFRTWRWQLQVEKLTGRSLPFGDAFAICSVSFAGTFLLPFRLGEFIRPVLISAAGYGRKSAALATVALERVVDGLVMTGVLGITLMLLGNREVPAIIEVGGYLALLVFGGAMAVFVAAYRWRDLSLRFWRAVLSPLGTRISEKLLGMLDAFIEGLKSLPTLRDVLVYMGLTLAYWLLNGLGMWILAYGMNLGVPVEGGFFALACLVVGITIPAGPGNVGNFEYAIQVALKVFGVSMSDGFAYAIWTHLTQTLHMLLTAAVFLVAGKVSFRAVKVATRSDDEDRDEAA